MLCPRRESLWARRRRLCRLGTFVGRDALSAPVPSRKRHIVSLRLRTNGFKKSFLRRAEIYFPFNASTPELERLAARPGTSLPDRLESAESTAPQGTGETDLRQLRPGQLRGGR